MSSVPLYLHISCKLAMEFLEQSIVKCQDRKAKKKKKKKSSDGRDSKRGL